MLTFLAKVLRSKKSVSGDTLSTVLHVTPGAIMEIHQVCRLERGFS